MIWSPVTSRRCQPIASGRACSSEWGMSSPFPASPATGWRAHPASPASGGDGVCGVRLCQGVLVGGHVLSFCLVGYAVLDGFGGQGWVASPRMASSYSWQGRCRDRGEGAECQVCSRLGHGGQQKPCVSAARPRCCGRAPVMVQVKESQAMGEPSSLLGWFL